jgi:tetratricopeptide (TPR) repeat protein
MKRNISVKTISVLGAFVVILVGIGVWRAFRTDAGGKNPPKEFVTYVDRGLSESQLATQNQKIADLKAQIAAKEAEGDPDVGLILQLGNAYYGIGELALAVEQYDAILKTHPTDAPSFENKGQALYEMGDYAGAEANWRAASAVSPYEVTTMRIVNLIQDHYPARQAEIQGILEQAIANMGQSVGLVSRLGEWYAVNGMFEEAVSHYEVAVKLDSENERLQERLAELKAARKNTK